MCFNIHLRYNMIQCCILSENAAFPLVKTVKQNDCSSNVYCFF